MTTSLHSLSDKHRLENLGDTSAASQRWRKPRVASYGFLYVPTVPKTHSNATIFHASHSGAGGHALTLQCQVIISCIWLDQF